MISTNQLPNFSDKTIGLWRRMLFVPFDKTIPIDQQNPDLIDELVKELPGILNWAIAGLRNLTARGGFIEPQRCKDAIAQYRRDTNPQRALIEENYEFKPGEETIGRVAYQRHVDLCIENGLHPINSNNFGKEIKRIFKGVYKEQKRINGRREWVYKNLAEKDVSESTSRHCRLVSQVSHTISN
jgi:putative DNA primase/helicase